MSARARSERGSAADARGLGTGLTGLALYQPGQGPGGLELPPFLPRRPSRSVRQARHSLMGQDKLKHPARDTEWRREAGLVNNTSARGTPHNAASFEPGAEPGPFSAFHHFRRALCSQASQSHSGPRPARAFATPCYAATPNFLSKCHFSIAWRYTPYRCCVPAPYPSLSDVGHTRRRRRHGVATIAQFKLSALIFFFASPPPRARQAVRSPITVVLPPPHHPLITPAH